MTALDEDRVAAPLDASLARRLLRLARPHARAFALALLLAFLAGGVESALPWLSRAAIDRSIVGGERRLLPWFAAAAAGVLVVRYAASLAGAWLTNGATQRILSETRRRVAERLLRAPLPWLESQPLGRLVARATSDVAALGDFYAGVLVTVARDVCLVVAVIVVLARMDGRLCLIAVAALPAMVVVSWEFRRRARDAFRELRASISALLAWLQEHLAGIAVLRLFARERASARDFAPVNEAEFRANMRQLGLFALFQPAMQLIAAGAAAAVLWRGGLRVAHGALTVGELNAFLLSLELLLGPARDLAERYQLLQGAFAAAERLAVVLDLPSEASGALSADALRGDLAFDDVWFAYRGGDAPADAEWVLRGVSFAAPAGARVALVGPTGAGKSTIALLALGLITPTRGRVLVDGHDLREYDRERLRARVAAVFQETFLFAGSVADNLALRDDALPRDRLVAAAAAASIDGAIAALPAGWDAPLGGGAGLSSGERQLLALARALARDPRLLVLDEATAHVDTHTEERIRAAESRLLAGRTALVIAHRLATVRRADAILVLDGGEIRERGTHAELMALGGSYRRLVERQAAIEALAATDP